MKVDREIFKAYDIRGLYPEKITPKVAYHLGHAVATYLGLKQVVIGRDMRLSSRTMFRKLISGFLESGVNVVDIGLAILAIFGKKISIAFSKVRIPDLCYVL